MAERDEALPATPALLERDYCAGIAYDASYSSCADCGAGEARRRSDRVSVEDDGMGTDLELGLCLGATKASARCPGAAPRESCRILTARDFPSVVASRGSPMSSASSSASSPPTAGAGEGAGDEGNGGIAGCKRPADRVSSPEMRYRSPSQVVGWPPIRAYRINSLMNHNKDVLNENKSSNWSHEKVIAQSSKIQNDGVKEDAAGKDEEKMCVSERSRFVKVNMDGMPIGRKVDISAHQTYESLALALEDMFQKPRSISSPHVILTTGRSKASKLLDCSSGFVLTYEDKDGDWLLAGDVPWGMFLSTVKRLRIMRTSDPNGLAPRFQISRV